MVPYDPISALEKAEAKKEQNYKALRISILFGIMTFFGALLVALICGKNY